MSLLKSKTKSGEFQIRFIINNKKMVVTGKTLIEALKKVDTFKPIYL